MHHIPAQWLLLLYLCAPSIPPPLISPIPAHLSLQKKPSQLLSLHGRRRNQSFKVSCNANSTGEHDKNLEANLDRRDLLLGLGGLYGAANLAPLAASATPIPIPDLKTCGPATKTACPDNPTIPYSCCPPPIPTNYDTIPYYKVPTMTKIRMRSPAQNADEEYIAKYNLAISKMKELDKTEPLNPLGFKQQANIHCAYCNGAYLIGGKQLQVHNSWLFFPFHRWYLYFYERILGTLIGDPTFALPYWNWDNPKGMRLPPMYDVEGSSLYDERRNPHVRNRTIVDLGSFGEEVQTTELQLLTNNLALMYRQMVTNAPCPLLFFGSPYVLGNNIDTPGTIENIPHIPVHIWTGTEAGKPLPNGEKSCGEDMGNFSPWRNFRPELKKATTGKSKYSLHFRRATFQVAITELLEDIGLEDEETIAVTLVPKKGGQGTSIACADIQLADC
ncbi:hypothetical protein P3L10_006973 [Capsicum annuum]